MQSQSRVISRTMGIVFLAVPLCLWTVWPSVHLSFHTMLGVFTFVGVMLLAAAAVWPPPEQEAPEQDLGDPDHNDRIVFLQQCWADWRYFDAAVWKIPSVAFAITTGVLTAVYQWLGCMPAERTLLLTLLLLVNLALWCALWKHRFFSDKRWEKMKPLLESMNVPYPPEAAHLSAYQLLWTAMLGVVLVSGVLALKAWVSP